MDATSPRWQAITDSEFPWERDALAFVRDRLPDHDPYRAWSNFEFIADDGSINEVDLLVLTPKGFYLVDIKSRPGVVEGDQGTWTWRRLFLPAARPETDTDHAGSTPEFILIEEARLDSLLSALGLSARGLNALERRSVEWLAPAPNRPRRVIAAAGR